MTVNELKDVLYEIVKAYFADINVVWGRVGGVKMPDPVIVLTTGSVTRSVFPSEHIINGEIMAYYPSNTILEINYFADNSKKTENDATNDLEGFLNYIGSPYVIHECGRHNISIVQETAVSDLTGLKYESSWDYRAMVELNVGFMQSAFGYAGGADALEDSNETGYFTEAEIEEIK